MYCISVFGRNTGAVLSAMKKASEIADVIELRLDLMEEIELETLISSAAKPVLVTCRSTREGGKSDEGWDVISHRQKRAMEMGADFVDLEWSMPEPKRTLEYASAVMDIIYRPKQTALLDLAAQMGCVTIDGEEMFLRQAAAQFRLWTGLEAPFDLMRGAFELAMKGVK